MYTILLQAKEAAEVALQTSPYNALAYGVLVFVLAAGNVLVWREYKQEMERKRKHVEKTIGLMQILESKMDGFDKVDSEISDLKNEIRMLRNSIEN